MLDLKEKLIVALDVDAFEKAQKLVGLLSPRVKFFKVGSQLFTACGPEAIKMIGEIGGQVFLDLKFHDIPNTVYSAVASGTSSAITIYSVPTGLDEVKVEDRIKKIISYPVFMMTVHTGGVDKKMLSEAVRGASEKASELKIKRPLIVGVTVLTSQENNKDTLGVVLERAKFAQEAGLDGVVCSVSEAATVRKECGEDFIIVTPGIRPSGMSAHDQKRTATVSEAIKAGSDFLVVGRPILEAKDPLEAVKNLLQA